MAPPETTMKLVDHLRVSPPPGSLPKITLKLTFFDVFWLLSSPVQHLFFFNFHHPTSTQKFLLNHLHNLKHSLSLALKLYYPLAGNLIFCSHSGDHLITYADGDSVSLTLAESYADFDRMVADYPRDVKELHPFVPPLPSSGEGGGNPLLALQVTIFPSSGICVGTSVHHVAADWSSSIRFMRSWASIFKSGGDVCVVRNPPVFDRSLVGDLDELKRNFLEDMKRVDFPKEATGNVAESAVRSTFILTRSHIDQLRDRIVSRSSTCEEASGDPNVSSFALTCGYVWSCLAKARANEGKTVNFAFPVDCRFRLSPPVPGTYFGNCIGFGVPNGQVSKPELIGEDGLVTATRMIQETVHRLGEGVLKEAGTWLRSYVAMSRDGLLSVSGSNRTGVYEIDFGWGRPCKVEIISIEANGSMSLTESRDESDVGIEIGMAGPASEMKRFGTAFKEGLDNMCIWETRT